MPTATQITATAECYSTCASVSAPLMLRFHPAPSVPWAVTRSRGGPAPRCIPWWESRGKGFQETVRRRGPRSIWRAQLALGHGGHEAAHGTNGVRTGPGDEGRSMRLIEDHLTAACIPEDTERAVSA